MVHRTMVVHTRGNLLWQRKSSTIGRISIRGRMTVLNAKTLDDLARRLAEAMPPGLHELQLDMEKNLRAALESAMSRLDLVSREEFEVQRAVLARSRQKIEALEAQVAKLEEKLHSP